MTVTSSFRRDANYVPITTIGLITTKTRTYTGATGNGAQGTSTLFVVTGDVLVDVFGIVRTNLAGATATIRVGVTGNEGVCIATTTATDLDANMGWDDSTPTLGEVHTPTGNLVGGGLDIIETIATADITAGSIEFYCVWVPLSSDGNVTAA